MLNQIASILSRLGLTANAATILGFLFSVPAALCIVLHEYVWAAAFISISGIWDLVDGSIARLKGPTPFGALFDSSLDRYTDAVFWGAALLAMIREGESVYAAFAFSTLVGSFETSYVRARSEGLGQKCQVGFWERGERTVYLIAALLFGNLKAALVILGIFTHLTALERILFARRNLSGKGLPRGGFLRNILLNEHGRKSPYYVIKAGVFLAILAGIRP